MGLSAEDVRPQLVLVPGLLNDADLFADQVAALSDVCRPVVADITHGETLDALVDAVLEVAEDDFALCGFSLGGIVALETIKRCPERVTHLALLDTTMLPDDPDRAAERLRLIALARQPGRFHGFGEALLKTYLAPENLKEETVVTKVRRMTERLGPEVFVRQSRIVRADNRRFLSEIACPTLVLCGRHDRLTPPDLHRAMAREIPGAELIVLEKSGHLTPIEEPDAVSDALRSLVQDR